MNCSANMAAVNSNGDNDFGILAPAVLGVFWAAYPPMAPRFLTHSSAKKAEIDPSPAPLSAGFGALCSNRWAVSTNFDPSPIQGCVCTERVGSPPTIGGPRPTPSPTVSVTQGDNRHLRREAWSRESARSVGRPSLRATRVDVERWPAAPPRCLAAAASGTGRPVATIGRGPSLSRPSRGCPAEDPAGQPTDANSATLSRSISRRSIIDSHWRPDSHTKTVKQQVAPLLPYLASIESFST